MNEPEIHIAEKIENYILNRMSAEERILFEKELNNNPQLAKEVDFQKFIIAGVRDSRRKELKAKMAASTKKQNTWKTTLAMAAVLLIAVMGVTYLLFFKENKLNQQQMVSSTSLDKNDHTESLTQDHVDVDSNHQTALQSQSQKNIPNSPSVVLDSPNESEENSAITFSTAESIENDLRMSEPAIENIKSDVLLKDTVYTLLSLAASKPNKADDFADMDSYFAPPPQTESKANKTITTESENEKDRRFLKEKELKKSVESKPESIANAQVFKNEQKSNGAVVDKKETSSNLKRPQKPSLDTTILSPDKVNHEQMGEKLKVSFWKSPVNFKGYKYFRADLILYGITPSEKMKLYKVDGNLYLQNNKKLYLLKEQNDYNSFVEIMDKEILHKFGL